MDLSTTARVKTMAGITGSSLDTLIGVLVTAYSAEFEKYLGRYVESSSRTETVRIPPMRTVLWLKGAPVGSVTSIKLSDTRDFTDSTALTEDDEYVLEDESGFVTLLDEKSPDERWCQVVYTGGMAANQSAFTTAYPDISAALDMQVAEHIMRRQTGSFEGSTSDGKGNASPFGAFDLTAHAKSVLNGHRRVYV